MNYGQSNRVFLFDIVKNTKKKQTTHRVGFLESSEEDDCVDIRVLFIQ